MRTIMCFGDSNTWGFMPWKDRPPLRSSNRFPWEVRWTGRLERMLGDGWRVIEEGLNGRTTKFDCYMEENRNGLKAIDMCLSTAKPVDLVILMLGTNDTKSAFNLSPGIIAYGMHRLILRVKDADCGYGPDGQVPEILVVSPARMTADVLDSWLADEFDAASVARGAALSECLRNVALGHGVHYLDAAALISADSADGIHMNAQGHEKMAQIIGEKVREIFDL